MKRLYEAVGEEDAYGAVGFDYGDHGATQQQQAEEKEEEEDEPYEAIPELQVPKGVNLVSHLQSMVLVTAGHVYNPSERLELASPV